MKKYMAVIIYVMCFASLFTACSNISIKDNEEQEKLIDAEKESEQSNIENPFKQMVGNKIISDGRYSVEDAPEFLSDENKELFTNAEYIMFNFSISTGFDLINYESEQYVDLENEGVISRYYQTEYNYSDFTDYIKSVFTEEESNKLIDNNSYINIDGKLYCIDSARGSDISYVDKNFELINKTDDEIIFKAIAEHSWREVYESEKEYRDEGNTDNYEWEEESTFKLINTDKGYRVEQFEYWK